MAKFAPSWKPYWASRPAGVVAQLVVQLECLGVTPCEPLQTEPSAIEFQPLGCWARILLGNITSSRCNTVSVSLQLHELETALFKEGRLYKKAVNTSLYIFRKFSTAVQADVTKRLLPKMFNQSCRGTESSVHNTHPLWLHCKPPAPLPALTLYNHVKKKVHPFGSLWYYLSGHNQNNLVLSKWENQVNITSDEQQRRTYYSVSCFVTSFELYYPHITLSLKTHWAALLPSAH